MAKNRTEKCTYLSRYGGEWVSPAQYITEFVCERKAQNDLPLKFWQLPEWNKYFRNQITAANQLLKDFEVKAILQALRDKRAKRIFSLRAPWLREIVEEKQQQLTLAKAKIDERLEEEIKEQQEEEFFKIEESDKKPVAPKRKSKLSRLKEFE